MDYLVILESIDVYIFITYLATKLYAINLFFFSVTLSRMLISLYMYVYSIECDLRVVYDITFGPAMCQIIMCMPRAYIGSLLKTFTYLCRYLGDVPCRISSLGLPTTEPKYCIIAKYFLYYSNCYNIFSCGVRDKIKKLHLSLPSMDVVKGD
jgi:hypothetical protein